MKKILLFLFLTTLSGCCTSGKHSALNTGSYKGRVSATWCNDGRRMELLEEVQYTSPSGKIWIAPQGAIINGASIPPPAWPIIGGPFEGKYRAASVLHDVACQQRAEPFKDVHRMFYEAMLCSGVSERKAKVMYWAVYNFGPKWSLPAEPLKEPACNASLSIEDSKKVPTPPSPPEPPPVVTERFKEVADYIEKNNPTLEEIEEIK